MKFFFYLWVINCPLLKWEIPFYFRNFLLNELILYLRLHLFQLQSKNKFTIEKNIYRYIGQLLVPLLLVLDTTATVLSSPTDEPNNNTHSRLWPQPTSWMIPAYYLDFYNIEKSYRYERNLTNIIDMVLSVYLYNNNIWLHCKNITIDEFNFSSYQMQNQKCIRIWKNGVHKQETTPTLSFIFSDQNMAILERRSGTEIK